MGNPISLQQFQSAPGDEAGRNPAVSRPSHGGARFNPLPAMKPGGTQAKRLPAPSGTSFNPLPAMKPGGTFEVLAVAVELLVSIRSRR